MVDVLRHDFVMAARASGLPERRVVFGHALRNAIIPVLTYLGILFGLMLATAPVTETVFTWPGLGVLYINAIQQLDYPVIMGVTPGGRGDAGDRDAADRPCLCADRSADPARLMQDIAGARDTGEAAARTAPPGTWRQGWPRLRRNRTGMLGLSLVGARDPHRAARAAARALRAERPVGDARLRRQCAAGLGASARHRPLGYDVLSRVVYGAPTALAVGIGAMVVASVIGTLLGGISGYLGGLADELLMRFTEFFLVVPIFLVILADGAAVRHRRGRHAARAAFRTST